MKTLLTMELRSREALREAQKATRQIWVTPWRSEKLEQLNLEEINSRTETRVAFRKAIANVAGYPVIGWKYDVPVGESISNEKDVALDASKLSIAGV